MSTAKAKIAAWILFLLVATVLASAEKRMEEGKWVSAWSTAVHTPLPFPGIAPTPTFENQTIRMVVRPTIGGSKVRIRLSNAFGLAPLEIGSAHLALTDHGSAIKRFSDHALTFGGNPSVTVPVGAPVLSDPVDMQITPFAEISVSLYLPHRSDASTVHFWAQHETYISAAGDFCGTTELAQSTVRSSWYWLADVEVWTASQSRAIVALGDSITDGVGAKQGDYSDWPDLLARRLSVNEATPAIAVLNEGIGGNRILHDGAGANVLARFDRDVLAQPGVTDIILFEGINDIGWPHMKPRSAKDGTDPHPNPFASQGVSAADLIAGMRQIIDRAHEHHVRVFGATLTPYEGADYFSADGEQVRQQVNRWIRAGGAFDGIVDLDTAVRDPDRPARFRQEYQSGDSLHPSADGYRAMAEAIDLALIRATAQ